ncbi:MAG: ATP12 family chaperone protein [Alphaproteobacteria bacterium]|jgi:chaperone required for assembly of F1-ATPase|nr:chaperone, ATP12 [Acetobacteraceae bacterium]
MKRFWEAALAVPRHEGDYGVVLDGRPLRLPGGSILTTESRALAEAIAEEWHRAGGAKGGEMRQEDVPLTRILGAVQERIAPDPKPMVEGLAKYGETDLLCYRAVDHRLATRQAEAWNPLLEWAALALDAPLSITQGLMPMPQAPESLAALQAAVARHDAAGLAALGVAVPALGSLVLGLALSLGRLDAEEAHRLAIVDEVFQEEFWGSDAETAARRAERLDDVKLAARFIALMAD